MIWKSRKEIVAAISDAWRFGGFRKFETMTLDVFGVEVKYEDVRLYMISKDNEDRRYLASFSTKFTISEIAYLIDAVILRLNDTSLSLLM